MKLEKMQENMSREHRMHAQGSQTYVREEGNENGPTLVFLHGIPDSNEIWDDMLPNYSAKYRCLLPDLPGFGQSRLPAQRNLSPEYQGRWLGELLDQLAPAEKIHLVGHDLGAVPALAWACENQERVASVTIFSSVFFPDFEWHKLAKIYRTPLLGEFAAYTMTRKRFLSAMARVSPLLSSEFHSKTYERLGMHGRKAMLRYYRSITPADFTVYQDALEKLGREKPFRVVWGKADPFFGRNYARKFKTKDVVLLPKAGHWPFLEAPEEATEALGILLSRAG